jgi:hypothetical protein
VSRDKKRTVYAFEFSDKTVYVGCTCNISSRKGAHTSRSSRSPVKFHINSSFGLKYEFKILSEPVSPEEGSELEKFFIQKYSNEGYNLLNSTKGGEIVFGKTKWTKEVCEKIAKTCENLSAFYTNHYGAYSAASRNGFLKEICSHMNHVIKFTSIWTKELCHSEALKFDSRIEFEKKSPLVYAAAVRHGFIDEICSHMIKDDNTSERFTTFSGCAISYYPQQS